LKSTSMMYIQMDIIYPSRNILLAKQANSALSV